MSGTNLRYSRMPSPLGSLLLVGDGTRLHGLYMAEHDRCPGIDSGWIHDDDALADVRGQLQDYFDGRRTTFDTDIVLAGTPFQVTVWQALRDIPYGETISYGELARRIGRPSASRAVGAANGRNPVSIVVPCHRVIGGDGSLTGYGWGTARKAWLLEHENLVRAALPI